MSPILPTAAQSKLLLHHRMFPGDASFNISLAFRIQGNVDLYRLREVIDKLLVESVALNVTFAATDVCMPNVGHPAVSLNDAPAAPDAEAEAEAVTAWLGELADRPIPPDRWPLYRLDLHRGRFANYLTIVWSHLVSDLTTLLSFGKMTSELYAGRELSPAQIRALSAFPGDFRASHGSPDAAIEAYRDLLTGVERLTHDQLSVPRQPDGALLGQAVHWDLDPALAAAVRTSPLVAKSGSYPLFLAAHAVLASGLTGQSNVVIGVPMANRYRRDDQWHAFGYFVNTLPMAIDLDTVDTFSDLYDLVAARVRTMLRYRGFDLTEHASSVLGRRQPSSLHYDNTCTFYDYVSPFVVDGCDIDVLPVPRRHIIFPLAVNVRDSGEGYAVGLEYADQLATAEPERCLEHILRTVVTQPQRRLAEIGLVDSALEAQLASTGTPTAVTSSSLDDWFRKAVQENADRVAVSDESGQWTYAELDAAANAVAANLTELACGRYVAVSMGRRRELVAVLLGILRAGCAYVPLDPQSPPERIAAIVGQLPEVWLVADPGALSDVVVAHRLSPAELLQDNGTIPQLPKATDPAYVIFTSGSTGVPKGVEISHDNVMRLFTSTNDWFGFGPGDVWCLFHSYAFDFSVWELFGALLFGGRLVVPADWQIRSPEEFARLLAREGVTVLNQTPSAFRRLTGVLTPEIAKRLDVRWVVFGGEMLRFDDLAPWLDLVGKQAGLVNMYGITEITVHATFHLIDPAVVGTEKASVIGVPLPDLGIAIVDRHLRRCPVGVPGEVLICGPGVARGYLGRPDLTAQRFLAGTPYGDWVYRSGDRAYLRPDGTLVYLNRIDRQVQLRGYRIEPGEIESALCTLDGVSGAHVGLLASEGAEPKLVAWIVGASEQDLRAALRAKLPPHMVPSLFVPVPELPLNINGKVDVAALPQPVKRVSVVDDGDPVVRAVARIWTEVIKCDAVGADDNFFDVGGTSMHVAEIHRRLVGELGAELTMVDLFEHHTPRELATRITGASTQTTIHMRPMRRAVTTASRRMGGRA